VEYDALFDELGRMDAANMIPFQIYVTDHSMNDEQGRTEMALKRDYDFVARDDKFPWWIAL
jgi:hypothetical protein